MFWNGNKLLEIPSLRSDSWEANLDMDIGMQGICWEGLLGAAVLEWGKLDPTQGEVGLWCDCRWSLRSSYCSLWSWDRPLDVPQMELRGYSPYQQPLDWGCPQEEAENSVSAFWEEGVSCMRAFTLKGRIKQWAPTSTMNPNIESTKFHMHIHFSCTGQHTENGIKSEHC